MGTENQTKGKDTMETEFSLNDTQVKRIEAVMCETRKELEDAHKWLPRLREKLGDRMARAAMGEDNHIQIARIKRKIAEMESVIQNAPLVIKGLKRMK
jgi:hypothetical protein